MADNERISQLADRGGNVKKTQAIAWPSCAPYDGAAVEIHIARVEGLDCDKDTIPYYRASVYRSWPQLQDQGDLIALEKMQGLLQDCPGGNQPCKSVEGGTIQFDKERGILNLPMNVMQDMTQSISFTVKWCNRPRLFCG